MEEQNYCSIGPDQYQELDTQKMSRIVLKDGTVLKVANNNFQYKYDEYSFNVKNKSNNYSYNNNKDNIKAKKFNSFSEKVRYRNNDNTDNGFYVTPVNNVPKRIIALKVPDNGNYALQKDNYHIESFVFKSSPKKYKYKPYKPTKRNNNLKCSQTSKCYCYCNCPCCINNRKY